ncbi:hypothetical protein J6590_091857 [Homalodisca vitripennis]|nr:hypothetical protein J6590_091857 [Homalodisca vitripennis]
MMVKYTVCCLLLVCLLSVTVSAVEKPAEATDKVDQTPAASTTTSTSSPASRTDFPLGTLGQCLGAAQPDRCCHTVPCRRFELCCRRGGGC